MPHGLSGVPETLRTSDSDRAAAIRAVVDQFPPLTPEQRRRLRPILAAGIPRFTGCPCGCTSRPGYRDPDCVTLKPIGPPKDWAALNGHPDWNAA